MARVLEDVESRHGVCGKLVDEERLQLTLDEVEDDHTHGKGLGRRERVAGADTAVNVGSDREEREVNEDWTGVFSQEDSSPRDLWS